MSRDVFIDNWRGLFHIVLLVDHLPFVFFGVSPYIQKFFEPFGYVSVTEGFVFLSGYVSGIVYTRAKRQVGMYSVWRKALYRSLNIYACYLVAVILLVIAERYDFAPAFHWFGTSRDESLVLVIIKIISLIYQPPYLEILPMYCAFLLITPFVINQLEKGSHLKIIAVSILIWIMAFVGMREELLHIVPTSLNPRFGFFNPLGWQLLFSVGLICGHKTLSSSRPWLSNNKILIIAIYATAVCLFGIRHDILGGIFSPESKMTARSIVGPIRLLNFFCICFLVCRFREQVHKWLVWQGFIFLSKHSLPVFAFHIFPIYLVALFFSSRELLPVFLQIILVCVFIASLFFIAFAAKTLQEFLTWVCAYQGVKSFGER